MKLLVVILIIILFLFILSLKFNKKILKTKGDQIVVSGNYNLYQTPVFQMTVDIDSNKQYDDYFIYPVKFNRIGIDYIQPINYNAEEKIISTVVGNMKYYLSNIKYIYDNFSWVYFKNINNDFFDKVVKGMEIVYKDGHPCISKNGINYFLDKITKI
jgi:hypothetical protein